MKLKFLGLIIFVLAVTSNHAQSWSGYTCTRTIEYYVYATVCKTTVIICLEYGLELRKLYRLESYCCSGWTHNGNQNCSIPICSPACLNGGTCTSPNTCACRDGYDGDICDSYFIYVGMVHFSLYYMILLESHHLQSD